MTTKKFNSVLCALGLVAAFACTEEIAPVAPEVPEVTVPENLVEMTITASQDDTKSTFDGKKIGWELTDVVAVYDGVEKREFIVTSIDKQTGAATLKGYVDADATAFQAVYPYSAAGDKLPADGKINISVPATQKLVEGAVVAPGALVSVGEILEGNISFKNVVSLLKVRVTEEMTSVSVKGVKYENIAGDATATVAAVTSEGGAANIVLKPVGEKFVAGDYYIALLPTAFADGFTVAYRKESGLAVLKSAAAVEFPANGGFDVTGKDLSTLTWLTNPIMSESDLKTYLANQDSYAGEAVSLGQNITLTETWTPAVLTGNLDGAGYTISGLKVEAANTAGMFTLVDTDASLKNVTVEGSIKLTSASADKQGAGLASELKGTMYKVVNKTTVESAAAKWVHIGGLAGNVNGGALIECDNQGAVTLNGTSGASRAGGVFGCMTSGKVQKCINSGTVTSNLSTGEGFGGIGGLQQGGDILECTNNGTVVANAGASESYVAGIVGYVQNRSGKTMNISECINEGEIQVLSAKIRGAAGIAGVMHMWHNGSTNITGCYNNKAITVTTGQTGNFYLGGIVGRFQKPGSSVGTLPNYIKSCHNTAPLTVENGTLAARTGSVYLGGIAPQSAVDTHIEDCTNTGAISIDRLSYNYVGGIIGFTSEKVEINRCVNSGSVTVSPSKDVNLENYVGGVVGYANGTISVTSNENKAASVTLAASGSPVTVGGVIGFTHDNSNVTISSNKNRASVLLDTKSAYCPAGGVVGMVKGNMTSSDNINFGDVELKTTHSSVGETHCGGIVAWFNMGGSSATQGAETASLLRDKSFGHIKSVGKIGLLFASSAYNNYGKVTITDCVVGGYTTGICGGGATINRDNTEITKDNFAQNLWSYYKTEDADGNPVTTFVHKGTVFGEASTYDK